MVINQTKILFGAIALYLLLGKRQSRMQMIGLVLVTVAGIVITVEPTGANSENSLLFGVLPLVLAAAMSGLNAAICQKALQNLHRDSAFFTIELGVYGIIGLVPICLVKTPVENWLQLPEFSRWTWWTAIPIVMNSFGGVLVGLVTQHAGAIQKGICVIAGICLTAIAKCVLTGQMVGVSHIVSLILIAFGTFLHSKYPYQSPVESTKQKTQ
jgi:UDP-sugar transporter A1/2/3